MTSLKPKLPEVSVTINPDSSMQEQHTEETSFAAEIRDGYLKKSLPFKTPSKLDWSNSQVSLGSESHVPDSLQDKGKYIVNSHGK